MACGCPADQCTCVMSGDAYTGGSGNAADPFVVENTPFAPTSPLNSIQFTPGGVKNHSPGIDVQLSAEPNNGLSYEADGLMVDPCDLISADADNKLTCVADGLKVDACDIVTATQQAVGDIVIAGPDCTTQIMADPSDVNQVIGASGGQWGQRPIVSADIGNDLIVGSDGGVFGDFGSVVLDEIQRCDIFDVATTQNSGNIFIQGGADCRPELLRDPTVCEILGSVGGNAGWVALNGCGGENSSSGSWGPIDNAAGTYIGAGVAGSTFTNVTSCNRIYLHMWDFDVTQYRVGGANLSWWQHWNIKLLSDRAFNGAAQALTQMEESAYTRCSFNAIDNFYNNVFHNGKLMYAHVLAPGQTVNIRIDVQGDNPLAGTTNRISMGMRNQVLSWRQ